TRVRPAGLTIQSTSTPAAPASVITYSAMSPLPNPFALLHVNLVGAGAGCPSGDRAAYQTRTGVDGDHVPQAHFEIAVCRLALRNSSTPLSVTLVSHSDTIRSLGKARNSSRPLSPITVTPASNTSSFTRGLRNFIPRSV